MPEASGKQNRRGKAVVVVPFRNAPGHVGNYRCDRFIRWLAGAGVEVVVVAGGGRGSVENTGWGIEITVADPLGGVARGQNSDSESGAKQGLAGSVKSRVYRLARGAAFHLFNPDPGVVWARAAAANSDVMEHSAGAGWVISSSPPESAHVAAKAIAEKTGARLVVDMRDGWLDEPLKPSIQKPGLKRVREAALEAAIIQSATHVFVTSRSWKKLLGNRLPGCAGKIAALTNCYPEHLPAGEPGKHGGRKDRIKLLHAGRFMGSSNRRRPSLLLEPLACVIKTTGITGSMLLMGALLNEDITEIATYKEKFSAGGWSIETAPPAPKSEMMKIIEDYDGLLLLSVSGAAIPSKLFDYVWTRKPVLAASPEGSEVWDIASSIPQFFNVDIEAPGSGTGQTAGFLESCASGNFEIEIPGEFTIAAQRKIFLETLGID